MDIKTALLSKFQALYGRAPEVVAYAPGRVEILGNHTDYNEGYVLSAAINLGTYFAVAPRTDGVTRLTAGDVMETVEYDTAHPVATKEHSWSNYVKGVQAGLNEECLRRKSHDTDRNVCATGVDAMFLGNIPLGSGLSSSAALEVSAGLALSRHFGLEIAPLAMAKIAQQAEHRFAGVKCGLMDQMTSLFGKRDAMVWSDFRHLTAQTVPVPRDICFLLCNTKARHALVDGAYNERREACERAARYFASVLDHPVTALRDVRWREWEAHKEGSTDIPVCAQDTERTDRNVCATFMRRAAHPIGENERVLEGVECLKHGDVAGFGKLMFASHESSRVYFENSCPELDALVDAAKTIPGVLGARLTGGGFGGSVVVMVPVRNAESVSAALGHAYESRFATPCDVRAVVCSEGAEVTSDQ
ncbi:MAG: galactokinase [Kiritimatiellaeota bacterium]|nr:galactokinase [Kiritimatiellota bacterium]